MYPDCTADRDTLQFFFFVPWVPEVFLACGGNFRRKKPLPLSTCSLPSPLTFELFIGLHHRQPKLEIWASASIGIVASLRSRRLEVAGERENGRARGRHARGVSFSRARFFLCPLLPSAWYAGYIVA